MKTIICTLLLTVATLSAQQPGRIVSLYQPNEGRVNYLILESNNTARIWAPTYGTVTTLYIITTPSPADKAAQQRRMIDATWAAMMQDLLIRQPRYNTNGR